MILRDFIFDVFKAFLYFALSPLQWLFWKFPKVYEIIVTTIVFWKNSLPTKAELVHTGVHWLFLITSSTIICISYVVKLLIVFLGMLVNYNSKLIKKYS